MRGVGGDGSGSGSGAGASGGGGGAVGMTGEFGGMQDDGFGKGAFGIGDLVPLSL